MSVDRPTPPGRDSKWLGDALLQPPNTLHSALPMAQGRTEMWDTTEPITTAPILNADDTSIAEAPLAERPIEDSTLAVGPKVGGAQFWMIFVALMAATFLSALDLSSVSTTLPAIVHDLNGTDFVWVGSAYALGSTAILPLCGGLAQIFGRRPVVLGSLMFFALGSGVSGGAINMNMLIAGRTLQGIGGGGILALTEIILADILPLAQRGAYMGTIGGVWAIASAIGPPVGGAFSDTNWRWLFYMNLPICGVALVLVAVFLNLKTPQDDFKTKIRRMDWIGNGLVIISTTIGVIALTWAGVKYPWSSVQVLVPLILGIAGLIAFFVYEFNFAKEPVVPWELFNNRTSLSGHSTVFLHGIVATSVVYYLPVYFQGALMQSGVASGVSLFGNAFTIAPGGIALGVSVTILKIYRPQHFIGWALTTVGVGLLSLLDIDTSKGNWVGFQIIEGIGLGILYSAPQFPILAPLPVTKMAHGSALFTFIRAYSQTWGVAIGATILQNELKKKLPSALLDTFGDQGAQIAYAVIPKIKGLAEPLRTEVRQGFADALKSVWYVMAALSAVGFLTIIPMREIPLHEVTDDDWGIAEKRAKDEEPAA